MFSEKFIYNLILSSFSLNTFAITDQIQFANNYLNQSKLNPVKEKINQLGLDSNGQFSNQIYYKNIKSLPEHQAISNTRDIKLNNSSFNQLLQDYQTNNNLEATGIMNEETIDFIHSKQDEFGLNVTEYLDLNTWFISYNQPIAWQVKTVQNSLVEWNKVLEKQKIANSTKFVVVNIPNMRLTAYNWDAEKQIATEEFATRVVVGSRSHKTPLDDMYILGLKYNPTWIPTNNIIKRTLFKGSEINVNWLNKNKIAVFNNEGTKLDYSDITEENFRQLRFIQPSGNDNALGLLKFETNSKDNIYLHDTNTKSLFGHNSRAYSAGCVRVDDYLPLASWLAENDEKSIIDRINKGQTRILNTPQKTPVYTTYTQAYFDDPIPAFAPDPYRTSTSIIYK